MASTTKHSVKEVILLAAIKGKCQEYGYKAVEITTDPHYIGYELVDGYTIKAWPVIRTYPHHEARKNKDFKARIPLRDKIPKALNMDFTAFRDERYYQQITLLTKER